MSEPKPREQTQPAKDDTTETADLPRPAKRSSDVDAKVASPETKNVKELTAEEQMALFEKDLKENDWGHQPC